MAKLELEQDSTSISVDVFIQDTTATDGAGLPGLVHNSPGLTCYYHRPGANPVQLPLVTQTVTGPYSSGGFVELSAANMPGFYRLDLPNAMLAAGVNSASLVLQGAANMAPLPLEIQITTPASGTGDWTATERENIRDALGVTGTKSAATGGQLQNKSEFNPASDTVLANLTQILGTALTEVTGGRLAGNFGFFYRNNDAQTTKVVEDVGGSAGWSTAEQNQIRDALGVDGIKTTASGGQLQAKSEFNSASDQVTVQTNNDKTGYDLNANQSGVTVGTVNTVVTVTNAVVANLTQILGTALTEVTSGRLAGNFGFFYRNNDAQTTQVVDDVGGGAGGTGDWSATERNQIRSALGVDGTKTTAINGQLQTKSEFNAASDQVIVGTNNDKTDYFLDNTERTAIADTLLGRNLAAVTGPASRSMLNALRFLRNRWDASSGQLIVYEEDDATIAWQSGPIQTDPAAEPITGVDPT